MKSEFQNSKILIPFVTSRRPKMTQNDPKWPKNHLKFKKNRENDCSNLKMSMGNLSGEEKPMIKSKIQNSKILTSFVTSRTPKWPKMVRKSLKMPENSIKWLFGSKNEHGQSFWGEKTDDKVKKSKFKNLDPFCDVTDPQNDPKWSENLLKYQKTR